LQNVVKVNVFITTMNDFEAMNKGYVQFFKPPLPVCSSNFTDILSDGDTDYDRQGHALQ